jgi:ArsR family transcriptional regulator
MSLDALAQTFKALSEPLRLRIVHLLMQRNSLCVCDLMSILDQGQSTISRHLNYLKQAGLVHHWREGTWMHYALVPEALVPLQAGALQQCLQQLPELATDQEALAAYESTPRQCGRTASA